MHGLLLANTAAWCTLQPCVTARQVCGYTIPGSRRWRTQLDPTVARGAARGWGRRPLLIPCNRNLGEAAMELLRPLPPHRTRKQVENHYLVEKAIAERLKAASREERRLIYSTTYDELFARVPDHPRLTRVNAG